MNYIEAIFERCNIDTISKFLIHGTQPLIVNDDNLYEQNNKIYKELDKWLKIQFPELEEYNKQSSFIYSATYEIECVFMQIGIQAGFMIAKEFYEKQKNPSAH